MIKYQTKWHGTKLAKITAMEVLRETEKQVVLPPAQAKGKETRENKVSDWQCWFDTWDQAQEFLLRAAQEKVNKLKLDLQNASDQLLIIRDMKPPVK